MRTSHAAHQNAMRNPLLALFAVTLPLALAEAADSATTTPPPTLLPGLRWTNAFVPGVTYRADVPDGPTLLGFPLGERATTAAEIERCLKAWTNAAPDRCRLVEYARSHEDRPLHYLIVTSPANLRRLEEIQAGLARLGDPRTLQSGEAERLTGRLPAVAWLAYTIHGDETEGSDAALAVIHHLLAAEDPAVQTWLERLVIIIDPLMNPDGRERFLKMVTEHRGTTPNVDDESLLHSGYWPWGRGNHYLFDLNRDWLFGVHPETRGRIREVARWNPVLFVDAHGMGPQETHLFSPPREPINPNLPPARTRWGKTFAQDQARAFDRLGLVYYTGEWNEEWYPGYSDGWASYRGVVGILYEQARVAAAGVRRLEGRILSYRESVFHHVVGSLANLATASANARQLLSDFHASRQRALDPTGPYGRRTFAVLPTANRSRLQDFVRLLQLQGFELHTNPAPLTVASATDAVGRERKETRLPAGTLLVANRQPLGHLLAAMLEFDPHLSPTALEDERREILRRGQSRIYDSTAWSLTMLCGLEALTLPVDLPDGAQPYTAPEPESGVRGAQEPPVAYVFDGSDDLCLTAAARLLEVGVRVRMAEKPFEFEGAGFGRGSIVVTVLDNRTFDGDLAATVAQTARDARTIARAIGTGLGAGDLPDLGGRHFRHLERPRIATLGREGFSLTDYGSVWFVLDHRLGIRHSQLDAARLDDLPRYNVLIVPERGFRENDPLVKPLKEWVQSGGTLIALGNSVSLFIAEKTEFSKVRSLPDVLGKLPEYEIAVLREWQARVGVLPAADRVWSHQAVPQLDYPWPTEGAHPEEKELKKRDAWQALFMPQGALLASRIDTNHWLTAGCVEPLPILVGRQPVLMAAEGVEAPIRLGYLTVSDQPLLKPGTNTPPPAPATSSVSTKESSAGKDEADKKKEVPRVGWCILPEGTEMHLRLSGLLWPEAAHRLANAAYVTREKLGRGQIILFASPPTFRAATCGTTRVFLNAVVCGPGCGTPPLVVP